MKLAIEANAVYRPLWQTRKRYVISIGGRGGARSFEASQKIIANLAQNKRLFRAAIMRAIHVDIILVAIGKIETQMDGLREDISAARGEIKEINSGLANRMLNVEANAVSKIEVFPKLEQNEKDIKDLQDSRIEYRATIKAWIIMGGILNAAIALFLTI